jgi:RNase H-like domain found in reverse transcriptase
MHDNDFLSDTDPIYLHTDALDYGVGGYFSQLVDGKETPIAFVSKSLNDAQLRWAVIQKEAYAIFFACTYLQSPLRDRSFTILWRCVDLGGSLDSLRALGKVLAQIITKV